MTDMNPCPFCGAEPPDVHLSHVTGRIFCEGCGAEGPWSPFFDGDWNSRAADDDLRDIVLPIQPDPDRLPMAAAALKWLYEIANQFRDECYIGKPEGCNEEVVGFFRPYYDAKMGVIQAAIDDLANLRAIAARETRDAQMRAEGRVAGLREAAEIAGLNAWKHAGEDEYSRGMDAGAVHQVKACCDAIRALADKIEGDTVKVGGHYWECGE